MWTPLGPLDTLDLRDHDVCAELLAHDKHQLVEGMVFESVFDQYVAAMEAASSRTVRAIPVETATVRLPTSGGGQPAYGAFVWAKKKTEGLGRFLQALEIHYRVWLVEWSANRLGFTAAPVSDGRRTGPALPLDAVCANVSDRDAPGYETVDRGVRNPQRIKQSVWGYLSSHYGDRLGTDVVLPRIFINWGVQPWFSGGVWNLDRILLHGNGLWHMEIKHKYPMDRDGKLSFGINDGELLQIDALLRCGLRSLHVVTVKPFWTKQAGSMYLLADLGARSRAAVLATELTADLIAAALQRKGGRSGADTSFDGRSSVAFRSFEASRFRRIGLLSDSADSVARGLVGHMSDNSSRGLVTDDGLRALRMVPDG